ncbi:MAG: hypothetical protein R3B84_19175 [Zavarzinella sp.]
MTNRVQPSIAELMSGFLNRQDDAALLAAAADAIGDVEPHEVTAGFRTEPRLAWNEATSIATLAGQTTEAVSPPSQWGDLVARQAPAYALPMAYGNYPQRVSDLSQLVQAKDLQKLLSTTTQQDASAPLHQWTEKYLSNGKTPESLVAVGMLRAAGDLQATEKALELLQGKLGTEWSALLQNERATLAWSRGNHAEAIAIWQELKDTVFGRFNLGMAMLFTHQIAEAIVLLKGALKDLPEQSGWYHLAQLYVSLAEMKK